MYKDLINKLRELPHLLFVQLGKHEDVVYQAADAIEELEKSISRWIPVSERLPQDEETVLTWGNQETILLDWRHDNKWCCFGDVTHWMPLPEPPKEEH